MAAGAAFREPFPGFPPPLTTRPEGLLSMLGLQTNGRYPQHLASETLAPTIDLLSWYLETRAEIQSVAGQSLNALAIGGFLQLWQVPANEVWILLNCAVQPAAVASAQAVQLCRARANDNLSRIPLGPPVSYLTAPSTQPLGYSEAMVRHIIFRPSVQIGLHGVSGSGVGNSVNATIRFVRCSI